MCKNINKCVVYGGKSPGELNILDAKQYAKSVKYQWVNIIIRDYFLGKDFFALLII